MDSEAYSELCQTSKIKCFAKTVNSLNPSFFFEKRSMIDI